jgi:RsmE family RNA methyltransferase
MNIILFEQHEAEQGVLSARDERTRHLLKVLHKRAGDTFDAGVLLGRLGTGRIECVREDGAVVFSLVLWADPPLRSPIRMAVGFPRPIQLRRLLRDMASMGLDAIDLMGTDLGEKSYRDTKLLVDGGARAALIEGAVQARDTVLPVLSTYRSLDVWLESVQGGVLIAADNVRPQGDFFRLGSIQGSLVLAIGSERGWSDRERVLLESAGFQRLSLGPRCLRTETACVAAATAFFYQQNL